MEPIIESGMTFGPYRRLLHSPFLSLRRPVLWAIVASATAWSGTADGFEAPVAAPPLVPWPKAVQTSGESLSLGAASRIFYRETALAPLATVLGAEIHKATAASLPVDAGPARAGDIELKLDPQLRGESYALDVSDRAVVRGGNYRAVAWGTVTLLQALTPAGDAALRLPRMTVADAPVAVYRGLLIDLARQWHPIEDLRPLIDIVRMNEIIKKHGKQTICWEGFHGDGSGGVKIPKDVLVMPFESTYNPANNLVKHGYTVINTAWKPLYVVNRLHWPAQYIYEHWNLRLWEHVTPARFDSARTIPISKNCSTTIARTATRTRATWCG